MQSAWPAGPWRPTPQGHLRGVLEVEKVANIKLVVGPISTLQCLCSRAATHEASSAILGTATLTDVVAQLI
eukprot:1852604-Amphidinium_carterae.1